MLDFHKDHRTLVATSIGGFLLLSLLIAVLPAYEIQQVGPEPDQRPMTDQQLAGLKVYISEGCVACHTQQVRNIEMDKMWGQRPSVPSDYYYSKQRLDIWRQSPSILGSERTGPDLTNVGVRQPAETWQFLHLYEPRIVMNESVMPAYPWLFITKDAEKVTPEDVVVPVPDEFLNRKGVKVVATQRVRNLVSYLLSLKQSPVVDAPKFIPLSAKQAAEPEASSIAHATKPVLDGNKLYLSTCSACHQPNGQGLTGAFPPLAGSPIVNNKDPEKMIRIILQGYDARAEYAQMPSFYDQLSNEQIAAIANHERSSWGNDAPSISPEDVKKIRDLVDQEKNQ
jgi:cytochrome c oxidase cbb3-type subunit 2